MIKKSLISFSAILFFTAAFADNPPSTGFLMWGLPSSGITFPVYVYSNGQQINYLPSPSLQYFAGPYTIGKTNGTYQLYYQNGTQWHGCSIVLSNGSVSKASTCPGTVIGAPASYTYQLDNVSHMAYSNTWTLGVGATPWPQTDAPTPAPIPTNYNNRTITFFNNTEYPVIQLMQQNCSIADPQTPGWQCPSTDISESYTTIQQGASYQVSIPATGIAGASQAFAVVGFCNATSADICTTQCPDGTSLCSGTNWISTGGYGLNETPYATKIESTMLPIINGIPIGANNIDASAIDGFNIGAVVYPTTPAYCTYTVPPEGSNLLGTAYFTGINDPIQSIVPTANQSLKSICENSSQLPVGYSGTKKAWNLLKTDSNGNYEGCESPCSYAIETKGTASKAYTTFCCPNEPYNNCIVSPGQEGPNTSTYAVNLLQVLKNIYSFAYSDAGSDYACPPEVNFDVEFVPTAVQQGPTAPSSVTAESITTTTATITWQDSDPSVTSYEVSFAGGSSAVPSIQVPAGTTQTPVTGLTPDTTYSVTVTAMNAKNQTAVSTPVSFQTVSIPETFTVPNLNNGTTTFNSTSLTLSGSGSNSLNNPFTYTLVMNGIAYQTGIASTASTISISNLLPYTQYNFQIEVCDSVNRQCSALSQSSVLTITTPMETLVPPTLSPATNIGDATATLSWTPVVGANSDPIAYTITLNNTENLPAGTLTTLPITGLTQGTSYTATVKGCDSVTNVCSSPSNAITFETSAPSLSNLTFKTNRVVRNLINILGQNVSLNDGGTIVTNPTLVSAIAVCRGITFESHSSINNDLSIQLPDSYGMATCMVTLTAAYDGQQITSLPQSVSPP